MDFLEFLKNSSNNKQEQPVVKKNKKQQEQQENTKNQWINQNDVNKININTISTYKTINRGDFIKIIYQKNSQLNCYKGYIGEVKEYRKDQDYALVFLYAINSPQFIKFPLTHFVQYNY